MLDLNKPLKFRDLEYKVIRVVPIPETGNLLVVFKYKKTENCGTTILRDDGYYCDTRDESVWDLVNVPEFVVTPGIYKTRNGSKAYVYTTRGRGKFPVMGEATLMDGLYAELWYLNGRQSAHNETGFDLVERIGDLED